MYSTTEHIFRALQAGAKGYLLKESAGAELVAAVRSVHAGRRFLSQKITESVVDNYIREHVSTDPLGTLSSRERQILQLVAAGKSTADIARALFAVAQNCRHVSQPPHAEARYRQFRGAGEVRDRLRVDAALTALAAGVEDA